MDEKGFLNASVITFSWYDYILFTIMLLVSILIGIYLGFFGKKQSTKNDYLMGGKKMKSLPIAISLVASNTSGIILIGLPADIYRYGATFWLEGICMILLCIATISIYLPVFYNLQITSIYEYLERRFDNKTRTLASFLFSASNMLYLPITVYVPVLACSAATGISIHIITPVICAICIFYTASGGLKAVVWTDVLQFTITMGTFTIIFILGLNSVGGFSFVWNKALDSGRLDIFDFDPDPTKRDSFWIICIGLTVFNMSFTTVDQAFVQKFLAIPTFRDSALSLIYYAFGRMLVHSLCILTGFIIYAKYSECDPFTIKVIETNDQLLPYYLMDIGKSIPGLAGLFIAGIVSAALSAQSAYLNCLAGTIYEDFVSKFLSNDISEKAVSTVLKIIVVIVGIIITCLAFIIEYLGDVFPLMICVTGMVCGPILGIFTMGLLFPKANAQGAFYGGVIGIVFAASIIFPAKYYEIQGYLKYDPKPLSINGCVLQNESFITNNLPHNLIHEKKENSTTFEPPYIFRISFYYYTLFGVLTSMIVGLIISYLTNKNDPIVDKTLISPVSHFWFSKEEKCSGNTQYRGVTDALSSLTSEADF